MAKSEGQIQFEKKLKEQKDTAFENKLLAFLMPGVGLIAFVVGLTGFILVSSSGDMPIMMFLLFLFVLGMGGMVYGLIQLIKKFRKSRTKEVKEPDEQ